MISNPIAVSPSVSKQSEPLEPPNRRNESPARLASWIVGNLTFVVAALLLFSGTASSAYSSLELLTLAPEVSWLIVGVMSWFACLLAFSLREKLGVARGVWVLEITLLFVGLSLVFGFSDLNNSTYLESQLPLLKSPEVGAGLAVIICLALTLPSIFIRRYVASPQFVAFHNSLKSFVFGTALLFLLLVTTYLLSPPGVTKSFSAELTLFFLAFALLAGALVPRVNKRVVQMRQSDQSKLVLWRVWFLALSISPVPNYLALNSDFLDFTSTLILLGVVLALNLTFVVLLPFLLSPLSSEKTMMAYSSAGLFTVMTMPSISGSRGWFEQGNLAEQLVILVAVLLATNLFSRGPIWVFALAVVTFFSLNTSPALYEIARTDSGRALVSPDSPQWAKSINEEKWGVRPDVYFLVYESYANPETMNAYGIDVADQMIFLEDSGFEIYDGTYSLGGSSLRSLGRVFEIAADVREGPRGPTSPTAGYSLTTNILRGQGYETHGIFPSSFYWVDEFPGYDVYFPEKPAESPNTILASIFRGEFRYDQSVESANYTEFLEQKKATLRSSSRTPRFVYSHNSFPGHSRDIGACESESLLLYESGVELAHQEMLVDISSIGNLRDSIVILAGDHGPYLTKDCTSRLEGFGPEEISRLDIQDRHGAFLAIRWPDGSDRSNQQEITLLQDVFPLVFQVLSGDNNLLARARVDASELKGPSAVINVRSGIIEGGLDDGEPLFIGARD